MAAVAAVARSRWNHEQRALLHRERQRQPPNRPSRRQSASCCWLLQLRVGTKRAIEEYNAEVLRALEMVVEHPSIPQGLKLAFFKVLLCSLCAASRLNLACSCLLQESRHSYGRTALLLSGGGTMGCYHLGTKKEFSAFDFPFVGERLFFLFGCVLQA